MIRLIFAVALFAFASLASAAQSIHVEWGYTPPSSPAVTGFRLYQNGQPKIDWSGENIDRGDVTLDSLVIGDSFTLTALFADATESPHSSPFTWRNGSIIRFVSFKPGSSVGKTDKPGQARLR